MGLFGDAISPHTSPASAIKSGSTRNVTGGWIRPFSAFPAAACAGAGDAARHKDIAVRVRIPKRSKQWDFIRTFSLYTRFSSIIRN
jgi:hypothetical protein